MNEGSTYLITQESVIFYKSPIFFVFFFQAEDGIRDLRMSRGLGDVYKRQTCPSLIEYPISGFNLSPNTQTSGATKTSLRSRSKNKYCSNKDYEYLHIVFNCKMFRLFCSRNITRTCIVIQSPILHVMLCCV